MVAASLLLLPLLLLVCSHSVTANYRKFGFHNHDLCRKGERGRSLQLGAGAALLTLDASNHNIHNTKCSVKIEADDGFGLMVYVEDMYLRTGAEARGVAKSRCYDYVQFGRDDLVPFFTLIKSDELCGNKTGFHYDEPGGNLLVWLYLGSSNQRLQSSQSTRLTVVVTAYKHGRTEDSTNFRLCSRGDRLIRKEYFCDWRVNCALDKDPGDERLEICRHSRGSNLPGSTWDEQPGDWRPPLNLVSITLVLVSGVVLLVLVLLLVARMRRSGWWCGGGSTDECELPERAASAGAAAGDAAARTSNPERNDIYLPLRMYLEPRQDAGIPTTQRPGRGTTPDAEPPPAYHDLFPTGFKFVPEKSESASLDPMLQQEASKTDEDEVPDYAQVSRHAVTSGGTAASTAAQIDTAPDTIASPPPPSTLADNNQQPLTAAVADCSSSADNQNG